MGKTIQPTAGTVNYTYFTPALNCLAPIIPTGLVVSPEQGSSQWQAAHCTQHLVQCLTGVQLLFGAYLIFVDEVNGCWNKMPPEAVAV